jgi:hypothetical protein
MVFGFGSYVQYSTVEMQQNHLVLKQKECYGCMGSSEFHVRRDRIDAIHVQKPFNLVRLLLSVGLIIAAFIVPRDCVVIYNRQYCDDISALGWTLLGLGAVGVINTILNALRRTVVISVPSAAYWSAKWCAAAEAKDLIHWFKEGGDSGMVVGAPMHAAPSTSINTPLL